MKKNLNIYISKFKFKINLKLKYFLNVMLKYILTNFIVAISIPLLDLGLCLIYNKKARWFQLHAAVNFVILTIIYKDVFTLVVNPLKIRYIENPIEIYYIFYLHLYHMIIFKNTLMDYFHHIVFVLFGALPVYYFYSYNIIRLSTFVGCGLPGLIEYTTLSLVKNEKMSSLTQKSLISNIYNYFRYPFTIFSASAIYIANQNQFTNIPSNHIIFVMLMIFLNGSYL